MNVVGVVLRNPQWLAASVSAYDAPRFDDNGAEVSEATLIDGKAFAAGLREQIAVDVQDLIGATGVVPGLAVVMAGSDPASEIYVRNKIRLTRRAGMNSFEHRLDADVSEATVVDLVGRLNADPAVHGILVQLPMPDHIDTNAVTQTILPEKDVDGLTGFNVAQLATGRDGIVACTPLGCLLLLQDHVGDLAGKHAVIIGRSNLVGRPLAELLLRENCTVTVAHSRTRDLPALTRQADILVAALGRPRYVQGDWVKPGAIVIDVGINRLPTGEDNKTRLAGDVDFDAARQVAGAITPVPGGVGPMTIACLLLNTVSAAKAQLQA